MRKLINLTQNVVGLFMLVGIIGVAVAATFSLNPIKLQSEDAPSVQGAQILSNLKEPIVTDLMGSQEDVESQLVKYPDGEFAQFIHMGPQNPGNYEYTLLEITHENNVAIEGNFRLNIPQSLRSDINAWLVIDDDRLVLFANEVGNSYSVPVSIKPNTTSKIRLEYSLDKAHNYTSEVVLTFSY